MRKHHIIYRTTCLTTGCYYIGMHSTDNLADGYMGSGKRLWRSFNKHELHFTEILEELPSRETLRHREAEIVNKEFLADQKCLNLTLGGEGGWEYHNQDPANKLYRIKGGQITAPKLWANPIWVARNTIRAVQNFKNRDIYIDRCDWSGRQHSPETKAKMSATKKGKFYLGDINPSAGKPWVYHPSLKQCKKVNETEIELLEAAGWLRGRKMKFD